MSNNYAAVITAWHRKITAMTSPDAPWPEYPDLRVFLGPDDPAAAAACCDNMPEKDVMVYLFPNHAENFDIAEEMLSRAVPGSRHFFLAVGPETFFSDRVEMAVTLIRHHHVAFSVLPMTIPAAAVAITAAAIDHAIRAARRNYLFTRENRWSTLAAVLDNLPVAALRPGAALAGAAPRGPAVICGAGPSLRQCLPQLRAARERLFLIAVGHAVKPLWQAGITPDLVAEIDPICWCNWNHDYRPDLPLLATPATAPAVTARFPRLIWATGNRTDATDNQLWRDAGIVPLPLTVSRSVTITALDFAVQNGFDPIILSGNDLALGNAGETHAATNPITNAEPPELVAVAGQHGNRVMTTANFLGIKNALEAYLAALASSGHAPTITNSSADGAAIAGAPYQSFAAFCSARPEPQSLPKFTPVPVSPSAVNLPSRLLAAGRHYEYLTQTIADLAAAFAADLAADAQEGVPEPLYQALEQERRLRDTGPFTVLYPTIAATADDLLERADHPVGDPSSPRYRALALAGRYRLLAQLTAAVNARLTTGVELMTRGEIPSDYRRDGFRCGFCRDFALARIRSGNPELAAALEEMKEERTEQPERHFELLPTHQSAPRVIEVTPDGIRHEWSPRPENPTATRREVDDFLQKHHFDPVHDAIVFLAPGDWQHPVILGECYHRELPLTVVETDPNLLRQLLERGLFVDRLPPDALIVAADTAINPSWRRLYD
ncbi:MAG: DUF115 domain-containing protein, partial [Victivallales bacterium]|nr:DUF115 domain-containing protein [Victivallales bacterium]